MKFFSKRRILSVFLSTAIVLTSVVFASLTPVPSYAATQATYYVDPVNGNDNNNGLTTGTAFQTISMAKTVVRGINSNMTGDIFVYLRGGTYNLTTPLAFTTADSATNGYHIYFQKYASETPVISGGTSVSNWSQYSGNIYSAPYTSASKVRQLWVNGQRAVVAAGSSVPYISTYGTFSIAGTEPWALSSGSTADGLSFSTTNLPAYANPVDVEIVSVSGFTKHVVGLRDIQLQGGNRVALLQQPAGAIAFTVPAAWGCGFINPTGTFYFQNAFELLDQPGEFYLNRSTNTMYYYKRTTDNMSTATVVAPLSEGLLTFTGNNTTDRIKEIQFSGITFQCDKWNMQNIAGSYASTTVQSSALYSKFRFDGNWHNVNYRNTTTMQAAVYITNADGIDFKSNTFKNIGGGAINLANDSRNCTVQGNVFRDIGGYAINIGDPKNNIIGNGDFGANMEAVPYNVIVKNNYIYMTGAEALQTTAISAYFTNTCEISYNEVKFTPYTGISVGWWGATANAVKINNNLVEDTMRLLHDGAGIYTLGASPNSQMFGNFINRTGGTSMGNAIYTDQQTAYYEIKNNVCMNYPNALYWYVWGTAAGVHDLNVHDNYGDVVTGSEGQYATNTTITNNTSSWTTTTTINAAAAGLESSYEGIVPSDLMPSAGLGVNEAEDCVPLGRGAIFADAGASNGSAVGTIDLFGDGLRIGKTTSPVSKLTIYYASQQSGTYSLYINNIHNCDFTVTNTGYWSGTYNTVQILLSSTIPSGYVMELRRDNTDVGLNIDKIILDYNNSSKVEAESGTRLGRAIVQSDSSASGGSAVAQLDLLNDGLQFSSVPLSSTLTVYYASPNSGTYSVYVNGAHATNLNFTSNGVWFGSYTSASVNVSIPSGATVKLQRDASDSGLNIDYVVFLELAGTITSATYIISIHNFVSNVSPNLSISTFLSGIIKESGSLLEIKSASLTIPESDYSTRNVFTGMLVNVIVNGVVKNTYTVIIFGEVTGDGSIDIADLSAIKRHLLKVELLDGNFLIAGDIYDSSHVSISCLLATKKHILGISSINQNINH